MSVKEWWLYIFDSACLSSKAHAKAASTVSIIVLWETWKERNRRVFQNKLTSSSRVLTIIKEEAAAWKCAGADLGALASGSDDVP